MNGIKYIAGIDEAGRGPLAGPVVIGCVIMKPESFIEYVNDLSVTPYSAVNSYFAHKMNIRKRQVLIELNNSEYTVSAGAMQWTLGNVEISSDVKGVGDFLGKMVKGAVTNESAVKPICLCIIQSQRQQIYAFSENQKVYLLSELSLPERNIR